MGDIGTVEHTAEALHRAVMDDTVTSQLPIQLQSLDGGTFSDRAGFSDCSDAPATTPTTVALQKGQPNGDLTDVLAAVTSDITDSGARDTVGEYTAAGILDLAQVRASLESALNVDLSGVVDSTIEALTATLQPVNSLAGQTGTYLSAPQLNLDRSQVTSPTGLYQGTMTVTIADAP